MSKPKRNKAEEKIRIAKDCIAGRLSQNEAEAQAGVAKTVVANWIRLYINEGASAFPQRKGYRRYAPEIKEAAVKDYLSGKGIHLQRKELWRDCYCIQCQLPAGPVPDAQVHRRQISRSRGSSGPAKEGSAAPDRVRTGTN